MEEVLVSHKVVVGQLVRIVKWLDDVGEVGAKRELVDNMGEVHKRVINVLVAGVSVSNGGNVQVCCDSLHIGRSPDTASRAVRLVILRGFEEGFRLAEVVEDAS